MLQILDETLETGAVIAGAYRLSRILGEGGMGVVWAANEMRTNRPVALKFLRAGREVDPKNQQRFLREARAAMGVVHPNIARVEAVLETDAGVPFMVMELLEGESLRSLLDRRGMLMPVECARLLVQVVDAVAAAHASGVVHRDLKPENVFIVNGSYVRVLDFGIAKMMVKDGAPVSASLTSTGMLLGTPLYMAPEQIYGDQDIDTRADVWSLGIVFYECLSGRRPTDGDGFGPIIKRITTGDLLPLEQARRGLPARIPRLVGRMLSRNRDQRPVLAEIRDVLHSVALMGDELVPSARDPLAMAPTLPPLPASTTAGIEAQRRFSGSHPPPSVAKPIPFWPFAVGAGGIALVVAAGVVAINVYPDALQGLGRSPPAPSHLPVGAPPGSANGIPVGVSAATIQLPSEASAATQRRDGPGCLRALDQFDAAKDRWGQPSTDPASPYGMMRATCLALKGDCEGGKSLYARSFGAATAATKPTPQLIADATDSFTGSFCEGNALSPRDVILRANNRFTLVAAGYRTPTAAECHDWHAETKRALSLAKPRDARDTTLSQMTTQLEDHTGTCLAHAGACAEAFKVLHADWLAQNPLPPGSDATLHEQSFTTSLWPSRSGNTPCKGKP